MTTYKQVLETQIEILEAAITERRRELNTRPVADLNLYASKNFLLSQPFYVPEKAVSVQIVF